MCAGRVEAHTTVTRRRARLVARLVACLVLAGGCSDDASARRMIGRGMRTIPVVVAMPTRQEFVDRIEAIGTARANESIVVAAQVTETVSRVNFEDGQVVAAGDVLVELTSREESAQLAEARANHAEAVRQHERAVELRQDGTVSQAQLDARETQRRAARARLDELRARMRDRLIRAPFAGVLGMRTVSPGTLLQPGDPITTLDDIDTIKVDFSVPERFLSVLEPGLVVRATAAAFPDRHFEGTVRSLDTRVDPETRAIRVRADVPNADHALRPGMLVSIELTANRQTSLAVPEEAIVPVGETRFVFVVNEDLRADRLELETGRRTRGMVEVKSGISGSERLVVEGGSMLDPGSSVEIVEERTPAPRAPQVSGNEG